MTSMLTALALILSLSAPQEVLTNVSVEKLAKSGLSDDVIVNIVKTQPANFDLSVDGLLALKNDGVSDRIIEAMTARSQGLSSQPSQSSDDMVKVPLKTPVRLLVDEELSSGSAKAGRSFTLMVAEDLVVNGRVVVSRGAAASGRITAVQKKAFATRNGSLELTVDTVRAVDGQMIPLEGRIAEDGGAAGFGSVGKNVKIEKGAPVTAVVAAEREVGPKQ
jgi:hypothetical protein